MKGWINGYNRRKAVLEYKESILGNCSKAPCKASRNSVKGKDKKKEVKGGTALEEREGISAQARKTVPS